tara:strand:+ start:311 stop:799 length:489 start_codon:yes stop_codon:yes gene_type:complete
MSITSDSLHQISEPSEISNLFDIWQTLLVSIPYAQHLGLEVQSDETNLVVHLPYREALIGNFMLPALHGGVLGALIELSARLAAQSHDKEKRCPRVLDSNINYLLSAQARSTFASAEIVRQGRRISLVQVTCWQGDRTTPIASGRVQLLLPTMDVKQSGAHE